MLGKRNLPINLIRSVVICYENETTSPDIKLVILCINNELNIISFAKERPIFYTSNMLCTKRISVEEPCYTRAWRTMHAGCGILHYLGIFFPQSLSPAYFKGKWNRCALPRWYDVTLRLDFSGQTTPEYFPTKNNNFLLQTNFSNNANFSRVSENPIHKTTCRFACIILF